MPTGGNSSNDGHIHAVAIKLPEFWSRMPTAWFIQVESQFITRRITDETTKYHYVIQALPQDVIIQITDILSTVSETPYTNLKKVLIDRYSMSEGKRLEKLLSGEELGDKKPSDFYRHLKNLAGENNGLVPDKLIFELWMRRLPTLVQVSVKSCSSTDTQQILIMADNIFEVYQQQNHPPAIHAISDPSMTNKAIAELSMQNQQLQTEIHEIRKLLSRTNFRNSRQNHRSKSRGRNRSSSSRRNHDSNDNGLCWYHAKFGSKAENCKQPCSYRNSTN